MAEEAMGSWGGVLVSIDAGSMYIWARGGRFGKGVDMLAGGVK